MRRHDAVGAAGEVTQGARAGAGDRLGGMRRLRGRALVGMVLAALVVALVAGQALMMMASAQEVTPGPLAIPITKGVTGEPVPLPDNGPGLFRDRLEAGVTWKALTGRDPQLFLYYQETGTITVTADAPLTVFRADAVGEPGEAIAAGTAFDARPGDYFATPPFVSAELANAGDDPATFLINSVYPAQPDDATPTT